MSKSLVRQNFTEEAETGVKKVVLMKFQMAFQYRSMSIYFARDDVGLLGFYEFYKKLANKYFENGKDLLCYLDKRGGRAEYKDIPKPERDSWGSPLESMEKTLEMERTVYQALLDLHQVGEQNHDAHLSHYLEDQYLDESAVRIKKTADKITQLKRVGKGVGEWMFDQVLLKYA